MNTQLAFAFGMLAMVAITMLVTIVVGMVKVIKLEKQIKNLEQTLGHEIHMVQRTIYEDIYETRRRIDETQSVCDRRVDDETKSLQDEINNIYRMIDSRFDKYEKKIVTAAVDLINLQNNKEEVTKNKKQQLNG